MDYRLMDLAGIEPASALSTSMPIKPMDLAGFEPAGHSSFRFTALLRREGPMPTTLALHPGPVNLIWAVQQCSQHGSGAKRCPDAKQGRARWPKGNQKGGRCKSCRCQLDARCPH